MKKKRAKSGTKKRLSGGAHLKAAGKTGILIGVSEDQLNVIERACAVEGRSRANFCAHYAVLAATKLLSNKKEVS